VPLPGIQPTFRNLGDELEGVNCKYSIIFLTAGRFKNKIL